MADGNRMVSRAPCRYGLKDILSALHPGRVAFDGSPSLQLPLSGGEPTHELGYMAYRSYRHDPICS